MSAASTAAPLRTIFFGSGTFALPILDAVRNHPDIELVGIVSTPDRPAGRRHEPTPTPVAAAARRDGLPLLQPASLRAPEAVSGLTALGPALGILADYGRIVPAAVLGSLERGILNVHPSLLPRHRGASPIPAAILAGDREFGVTLIELVERLDAGPIVAERRWAARGDETAPRLEEEAAAAGAALLAGSLGPWLAGSLVARAQDEAAATLTRPLRREDGRLDTSESIERLERMVRAYAGWPGTFIETDAGRILVHAARAARDGGPGEAISPGDIVALGDGLALRGRDGLLELLNVQPAGGRVMTGPELRRGRPAVVGATAGS